MERLEQNPEEKVKIDGHNTMDWAMRAPESRKSFDPREKERQKESTLEIKWDSSKNETPTRLSYARPI